MFQGSRDLLLVFSRDNLSGEGDLGKHISYMGYTVTHVQTPLDELDYAITNLATDLRDGTRLTLVTPYIVLTLFTFRRRVTSSPTDGHEIYFKNLIRLP